MDPKGIICPCTKCQVGINAWFSREIVTHHLMLNGFMRSYKDWVYHGETIYMPTSSNLNSSRTSMIHIDRENSDPVDTTLLNDIFETIGQDCVENNLSHDFETGDPKEGEDDDINNGFYFNSRVGQREHHEDAGYEMVKQL